MTSWEPRVLEALRALLPAVAPAYGARALVYEGCVEVGEPPALMEGVPFASPRQALVDALEYAWSEFEPPAPPVQVLYTYSASARDYGELVELAVRQGKLGAVKLVNLASGLVVDLTGDSKWTRVYKASLEALGGKPVRPSQTSRRLRDHVHFALTTTVLGNGLYARTVSRFTTYRKSEKAWRRRFLEDLLKGDGDRWDHPA